MYYYSFKTTAFITTTPSFKIPLVAFLSLFPHKMFDDFKLSLYSAACLYLKRNIF